MKWWWRPFLCEVSIWLYPVVHWTDWSHSDGRHPYSKDQKGVTTIVPANIGRLRPTRRTDSITSLQGYHSTSGHGTRVESSQDGVAGRVCVRRVPPRLGVEREREVLVVDGDGVVSDGRARVVLRRRVRERRAADARVARRGCRPHLLLWKKNLSYLWNPEYIFKTNMGSRDST